MNLLLDKQLILWVAMDQRQFLYVVNRKWGIDGAENYLC